ncbi:HNH endonuclease family protein [Corynebacterium sp. KPL3927]|uniref:HNH endonuclease family protein n=1 Tax=Corynebacterium sp. KPL3927 TaxID=3158324 RepID=UPI0032ECAC1C
MNEFMGAVVLPFLMPLLRDVHESKTTPDDFLEVLVTIESYIVRRFVAGIPTNSLNKIFATMYAEVSKLHSDGTAFAPIVIYQLNRRSGSGRFPTDAEFKEAFATKDFYNIRAYWRQYLFDCLENGDSNDIRDVSTALAENRISIEHIMPQTLTDAWHQELGDRAEEIHESWLNRIGNLTVTGYNSSYSNSPFTAKKTMENGFDSSPYRLNELLRESDRWSLPQIEKRTEDLTDKALAFWKAKPTSFVPPEAVLPKEPMGESEEFSRRKISGFEFGDFRKTTKSWADMVEAVLKYLLHEHRTEILSFAETSKFLRSEKPAAEQARSFRKIDEGLYVQVGNNTSAKIWFLRSLFEYLDLDPEDLVFTFPVSKTDRTDEAGDQDSSDTSGKYAELTKFYDQLVEAQELKGTPQNTESLRSEFVKDFEYFSVTDPQALFGGKEITEFISSTAISEMSDDQVLAVLTQHIKVSQMLGGSYLHQEIINGSIAKLVHRLSELS